MAINLPSRRLVSQNDSAIIERSPIPRSKFTGSWTRKTAFDAGYLVPILVEEVLPGDHLSYDVSAYVRMSTPLFPMFDNQRIDTFFFFVPNRLVWSGWVKMMGEVEPGLSPDSYTVPQIVVSAPDVPVGSIADHMGLPVAGQIDASDPISFSALPFRAYNLIYNAWFRDENIQDSLAVNTGNGPDSMTDYTVKRRAKPHDYFTSALPWPQKFNAPNVPLVGQAPVLGIGKVIVDPGSSAAVYAYEADFNARLYGNAAQLWNATPGDQVLLNLKQDPDIPANHYPDVFADLSQATGVAINTLRQAWLVQSVLERDARGGTRYVEHIRSHFGVISPDFRLQRPEYIGGGQTPLQLTPIAQTAPTASEPLGALGAAGTAAGRHRASYAATEHGYIIGLINVRSELSYQQGIARHWSRQTRYDFYLPALAGLGEQAILRKEIYATGVSANDDAVFGYQERWHEYRTRQSEVTGIMRSTATGTLDAWHLAQRFTAAPTLNSAFIQDTPPMSRVLAAGALADAQQYLADIMFQRTAVRPVPMYGTPVLLGRF